MAPLPVSHALGLRQSSSSDQRARRLGNHCSAWRDKVPACVELTKQRLRLRAQTRFKAPQHFNR